MPEILEQSSEASNTELVFETAKRAYQAYKEAETIDILGSIVLSDEVQPN